MDDSDNEDDLTVIENELYVVEGGPQRSQTMPNISSAVRGDLKLVDVSNGDEDAHGEHVTAKSNGVALTLSLVKKSQSNEVLCDLPNPQLFRKSHIPSRNTIKDAYNARSKSKQLLKVKLNFEINF